MLLRKKVNLASAFMRNLLGDRRNIGYGIVLTKVLKKVKTDFKSKAPGKCKGDFNKSTLKRMKLPLVLLIDKLLWEELLRNNSREKNMSILTRQHFRRREELILQ